ncbi:MAG: leucine--tRNA ligase [Flavobacteriales bacterium]|nr:leucine--tRNA ligase [Flavobacteriales bacterium]
MDYNHKIIEEKWQKFWKDNKTYKTTNESDKEKFYVLDMFPYPSGAGLHVGHPLGYIASDIYSRFKKQKGFNVLHPMGYDSFGLPAEQYAIQTGQHPALTTEENIATYRRQLDQIGFSYDWDREVRTSDPNYYKWTQWIFIELFNSYYDIEKDKAVSIDKLIIIFEKKGNEFVNACHSQEEIFTASEWSAMNEKDQREILLNYRLAYLADTMVNWCPGLGTVLANEEVKEGKSERGDFPVERKLMRQWSLRITAYADRLLKDLDPLDWTDALKEMQRHWIGRSQGASVKFKIDGNDNLIEVFTTRPDTIFGVTFMVLAPENELVDEITTADCKEKVAAYVKRSSARSERERMAEVKNISGEFTGAYALHPFSGEQIPIWIGDYVLASYGTGAVMSVPAHDSRDYAFAKHFVIPIVEVVAGGNIEEESYDAKSGKLINSDFLNGLEVKKAMKTAIYKMEEEGIGKGEINFRLRDAIFGRQRYWGEPIPVYFKDDIPYVLEKSELPLELPEIDKYLPTEAGDPPLGRATEWKYKGEYSYELSTMPGWAGSSWYFLRYMDAENNNDIFSDDATNYWGNVDLYLGGAEHATGHLLYVRFWTKFLYDIGKISITEPAKKLVNQGMIQGRSSLMYRATMHIWSKGDAYPPSEVPPLFVSNDVYKLFMESNKVERLSKDDEDRLSSYKDEIRDLEQESTTKFRSLYPNKSGEVRYGTSFTPIRVPIAIVKNDVLDINAFQNSGPENKSARFILEDGKYICGSEVEKMSKRWGNVVNPDDLCERYGADTLRLYEMFLGPLEQHKPWDTNGIEGVSKFLRKYWRLCHNADGEFEVSDGEPTSKELKSLHKTIKKVEQDIEKLSFNTSVSAFMICVNELSELKCNNRTIISDFTKLLSSYAPHIAEEVWNLLGNTESISIADFPAFDEANLTEDNFEYPVSFNGKTRFKLELPSNMSKDDVEKSVLESEESAKWLDGKTPKKVIVVPNRIVNVVV